MYYFLAATAAAAVVAATVIAAATEATATAAQQNQDDDNNPGTTVVTAHKRCTSKWFQTCARTTFSLVTLRSLSFFTIIRSALICVTTADFPAKVKWIKFLKMRENRSIHEKTKDLSKVIWILDFP